MPDKPLRDLDAWVAFLGEATPPVLGRTARELAALRERQERITGRDVAAVVLRDPLMTLKVLAYIESSRSSRQITDITTIDRAVMMIGVAPFFEHFQELALVENALAGQPRAMVGLFKVMARAKQAALYARDWATFRHDINVEEIRVAALLHDAAEILMWCFAPVRMMEVRAIQEAERGMRSWVAQQRVLGVALHDLQLTLAKTWHLPALLQTLMDGGQAEHPRVQTVMHAVNLARHAQNGWDDPALPDDYAGIEKLLGIDRRALMERIVRVAQQPPPVAE